MPANALLNTSRIQISLWHAADALDANSKLIFSRYCMLALSIIFLCHELLLPRLMSGELAA